MSKQIRLDENAEIYKVRGDQSEKEKLKDLSFRGKIEYIWEYYRIYGLIFVVAITFIIYIAYSVLNPGPTIVFDAAIIDSPIDDLVWDELSKSFSDELELDSEHHEISLNTNFHFNTSVDYSVSMRQVLMARLSTGEIDVIIAPEAEFASYAKNEYFKDLGDQIPTDVYSKITDQLFLSDTIVEDGHNTEEDKEINAYGIYLNNTEFFKNNSHTQEPYILGIVSNSNNPDNTIDFIRYLFQMYP